MGVCVIKDNSLHSKDLDYTVEHDGVEIHGGSIARPVMEYDLKRIELILPTRLMDEHARRIINFVKAAITETPNEEIRKALVS